VTKAGGAALRPFFFGTARHRLFGLAGEPVGNDTGRGLLICPPFADEMNRARSTLRLLAACAAQAGFRPLLCDLYGTGDSDGDLADASWGGWLDDLTAAAAWLSERGNRKLAVVALRSGALLANDLFPGRLPRPDKLVLWQPHLAGKYVLQDLLRTRVAAAAAAGGRESVSGLRDQLSRGTALEASGYAITPSLAASLDQAMLEPAIASAAKTAVWIEVVSEPNIPLRPAAAQFLEHCLQHTAPVAAKMVVDPPFWATTETTVGAASVSAIMNCLQDNP